MKRITTALSFSNLIEALRHHATVKPEQILYRFLDNKGGEETLTVAELDAAAKRIARHLSEHARPHSVALLVYPPGLEFIRAFIGCLYAGILAVPVYLPNAKQGSGQRLHSIAADAGANLILIDSDLRDSLAETGGTENLLGLQPLVTSPWHHPFPEPEDFEPNIAPAALAFLQYTSGSTGDPKGVMVSHANLMHNQALICQKFQHNPNTVVAGWLPQYHDMGLIGNILQPLYLGATAVLMAPAHFLQSPVRWLEAITRYRATTSGGPDFGYRLCVERTTEEQKDRLDLSHWDVAFNGAEPVSATTLERFYQAFKRCGFRKEAFYPCYGLAEATLLVTGAVKQQGPTTLTVERGPIEAGRAIACSETTQASGRQLVSCGDTGEDMRVRIVNPGASRECAAGEVGEIWLHSPSVAQGYWRKDDLNEVQFRASLSGDERHYMRTGDLGFIHENQLYITGRLKDLIIIRGRNLYPQDIEATVQRHFPQLRPGCGACFAITREDEEELILVQELERSAIRHANFPVLWTEIRQRITEEFSVRLAALVLVKPATVPKTSSGKLRRKVCREDYEQARIEFLAHFVADDTATLTTADPVTDSRGHSATHTGSTALAILAQALKHPAQALEPQQPLAAYGLDSLQAAQIEHRLAAELNVELDMTRLLAGITVAEFLAAVTTAPTGTPQAEPRPSAPLTNAHTATAHTEPQPPVASISHNQRAIWQLQNIYPTCSAYNLSVPLRIRSRLDPHAFTRAVDLLLEHHPLLATCYSNACGQLSPLQRRPQSSPVARVDASQWNESTIARFLTTQTALPIDLTAGPVFRVNLLALSNTESIVQLIVHHIAVDAWSLQVLARTLATFYTDIVHGRVIASQPPRRYDEFVSAQHHFLGSHAGAAQIRQYRELLGQASGIVNLPTDFPRPKQFGFAGQDVELLIDPDLCRAIQVKAQEWDVTLYTFLLTAFQVLLYRITSQTQFLLGAPVSERPTAGFSDVIGLFVDLKLFPATLSPSQSFTELLRHVKETVLEVLRLRRVPTQLALQNTVLKGASPAATFPNVRFALQQAQVLPGSEPFLLNLAGAPLDLGELRVESCRLPTRSAAADLSLTLLVHGELLRGKFNFNSEIFRSSRVEKLAAMYRQLLRSILTDGTRAISALPLLEPEVRARQLARSGFVAHHYERDECAHHLIERQARLHPDAIAIVCMGSSITYAELNRKANRIAHHLRAQGVAPEDRIGLYLGRSIDMVVAFLAAQKAGACSVMLEPSLPVQRSRYIIEDSRMSLLLTNLDSLGGLDPGGVPVLNLGSVPNNSRGDNLDLPLTPRGAIYVIYTSGSTGNPKGVVGIHAGVVNRTRWMIEHFALGPGSSVLHTTPLSFVRAEREILFPLSAGATLVVLPPESLSEPDGVLAALERHTITHTASSPSLLRMILDHGNARFAQLRSLKHWFIGADALRPRLIEDIQRTLPTLRLTYFYGSTEVSSDVAYFDVPAHYSTTAPTTPVGQALPNTSLYILDPGLEPVGDCMLGELYVGGLHLARGYLEYPDLTAGKFIPDPFSHDPGARLYRTGDLAFRQDDDNLVVTGRNDDQVNVYGHRVELGEIEHAIRSQEKISDVVVLPHESGTDHVCLVAYVACSDDSSVESLRAVLAPHLPSYMIPGVFVRLDSLPLTPVGKIDRSALKAIDLTRERSADYVGPQTPLQQRMVDIFAGLLGLPPSLVSVERNFQELGANSALLSEFVARLNTLQSQRAIRIADAYRHPNIRELDSALSETRTAPAEANPSPVNRAQARRQALSRRLSS
jgi:amino acid adenylation domain-containing protein